MSKRSLDAARPNNLSRAVTCWVAHGQGLTQPTRERSAESVTHPTTATVVLIGVRPPATNVTGSADSACSVGLTPMFLANDFFTHIT